MASSESDTNADDAGPLSSPLVVQDYGSYDENSSTPPTPDCESNEHSPDSPQSSPIKRRRYRLYHGDSSVPVPRETQRRWNITSNDQILTASNSTLDAGSRLPTTSQREIEDPQGSIREYETDSDTECEVESSASEPNSIDSAASDSDASNSPENSTIQEHRDGCFVDSSDDTDGAVSDDNDGSDILFSGSEKTTDEAVLDVCNLFLKHRWTKASLNDTLQLLASTLPKDNNMPHSLHTLYNYVGLSSAPCSEKSYFYCLGCLQPKIAHSDICEHCNTVRSGVFYYFSITDQIKYMFEQNNLADAIDNYRNIRSRGIDPQKYSICDILDGSEYKRVKNFANGPYDVILMWNTDGVSLSRSSQVKFYPVLSTVCEVAPRLRPYYLMVNSLWVDASAPPMPIFLKPFVEELEQINEAGGVEWKNPKTAEIVKSKVFAPLFIGDAPVRGDVLKVMRYNAIYGCETCEQKAVKLPPKESKGRSVRRLVFTEALATERTTERMSLQGDYAKSENKIHVKGVKGKAVVEDIPLLNRATCTLAEYMHSVLLGVTRHFAILWFTKPGAWYIGNHKKTVDEFLTSIKVLDFMRDARKISEIPYFKASEFRSWLLFFSPVVLQIVDFPDEYYQHWILLTKSVYILLQDEISESDLLSAEIMLRCFLRDVGKLYSNYDYVYNVHQLSHLTTYVRRWGPLSRNSAFPYENFNGVLARMVHGTKHQAKELTENLKLARCIHVLDVKVQNGADGKVSDSVVSVHGKAGCITLTNNELVEILRREGFTEFETYKRASFKRVMYTSFDYDVKKKKCGSVVEFYHEGKKCTGEIICFVKAADNILCYVEKFKIRQSDIIFHRESLQKIFHLLPVEKSNVRVLVEFRSIICKLFQVGHYIASLPNKVEKRL